MSKKDDYFAKMDSRSKNWDAEVNKLRGESEQMGVDVRAKFAQQLKTMRATRDAAFQKMEELHGIQRIGVATFGGRHGRGMGLDEERPGEGFRQVQEVARRRAHINPQAPRSNRGRGYASAFANEMRNRSLG